MERKKFLTTGLTALGVAFVAPLSQACKKSDAIDNATEDGPCAATPAETEGPFPTHSPSTLAQPDIRGDRSGLLLTVNITVSNRNQDCAPLADAIVDIWHCDTAGNYSEYGGTGMQSTNYTNAHWLRGRQTTDQNGLVSFTSIFPGWYSGRAPHIHVHIYNKSGQSLLVTQIAFPTDICNAVYTTVSPYKSRGTQDTSNDRDNVFADSLTRELATLTGNTTEGYLLTHTINVNGG
ncbi:intradiol ring-cleavage dioxygenase [Niabella terrae]